MAKLVKTIRNNWKKSVLFSGIAIYAANYGKRMYEDSLLRAEYCTQAQKYGETPLPAGERVRKITVFLNPAADKGRGKKLFEKTVAPLLYLAGCEVTVVKTEYEGQVKKYMEVLEETDAIIAAGGDGTLLEVVTGLLRRHDEAVSKIPIGVIPIGKTNQFAHKLFLRDPEKSDVCWLAETAMAIVRNVTKEVDVMSIKGDGDKTVYALSSIDWGFFRDVHLTKKNYWYLGPLKDYWAYIRATVGLWPHTINAKLTYSYPCNGCSRCVTAPPQQPWRWWHIFIAPKVEVPKVDFSKVQNDKCGTMRSKDVTAIEFACSCNKTARDGETPPLLLTLGSSDTTKLDFINEGFSRVMRKKTDYGEEIPTNGFKLEPILKEDEESWFSIDSEEFETMSIDVKVLKNKLNVFCPRPVNIS